MSLQNVLHPLTQGPNNFTFRLKPRTTVLEVCGTVCDKIEITIGNITMDCKDFRLPYLSPNLYTSLTLRYSQSQSYFPFLILEQKPLPTIDRMDVSPANNFTRSSLSQMMRRLKSKSTKSK